MEGVQVGVLTPEIAQQLNLPTSMHGVVITRVDPDSPSADDGLQRGDVIQEIDHAPVINVSQFRAAVRKAGDRPVLLLVNRRGNTTYVVVSPR